MQILKNDSCTLQQPHFLSEKLIKSSFTCAIEIEKIIIQHKKVRKLFDDSHLSAKVLFQYRSFTIKP